MKIVAQTCVIALLVAFAMVACGKGGKGGNRLVGTWGFDLSATAAASDGELSEQERELLRSMNMTFTFNDDGTVSMAMSFTGRTREETGHYEITAEHGASVTVTMTSEDGDTQSVDFTFYGNDKMSIVQDGQTMLLARQ